MQQKKVPMRSCIGCGRTRPKKEMIRIVRTPSGDIVVDSSGRTGGRGCYLCPDAACLDRAVKRKALGRALEAQVPPEIIEELKSRPELEGSPGREGASDA